MSRNAVKTNEPTSGVAQSSCQHRWLIATPNGATVPGTCRRCGEERAFPTVAESNWGETFGAFQTPFGGGAAKKAASRGKRHA